MPVQHVIIPAAGLGTRFLPITKTVPKELLPIGGRPAIDYILEECHHSNMPNIGLIINNHKRLLLDYLTPNDYVEDSLRNKQAQAILSAVDQLHASVTITPIIQEEPKGLGHAIFQAEFFIKDPYFAVCLPDDILTLEPPLLTNLATLSDQYNAAIIAVMEVEQSEVSNYGIITPGPKLAPNLYTIHSLIEKPTASQAPSNLAIIGRYILPRTIFNLLKTTNPGANNEIQLTDAINQIITTTNTPVLAYHITQPRFDTGTPPGLLKANNYFANP